MSERLPEKHSEISVKRQIFKILFVLCISILVIIVLLITMIINTGNRYADVLQNANTAADFNKEFKNTIDSEMYNLVIRPRSEISENDLPVQELDNAVSVLERLQKTTVLQDNIWRIRSMLNMCENLKGYMIQIANTDRYDDRMDLLDKNIRGETGLTRLIETYMHEYLDDEVRQMAMLDQNARRSTNVTIIIALTGIAILSFGVVSYSVTVSKRITIPIGLLSQKAARFGNGDFSSRPIRTNTAELRLLDKGFDDMASRIHALMEKQIADQRTLHKTELELLQAQINPHFLYNTLDSIAILAENGRDEDAVQMVNSLSAFFRISLSRGKDIILLENEINHVKSYLQIQQIRYSDILKYDITISDDITGYYVPKLILQPLVENALYHGIKNRRGVGFIHIEGHNAGDDILLTVSDNGAGMDEEQLESLRSGIYQDRHTGLGLVNVHKRIRLYCGEAYGLSFTSERGKGTTVTVRLPKQLVPEDTEERI